MAGKAKLITLRKGGKYGLHLLIFLNKVVHFSAVIWCTFHLLFAEGTVYEGYKKGYSRSS